MRRSSGSAEHEVVRDVHGVVAVLVGGVDVAADVEAVLVTWLGPRFGLERLREALTSGVCRLRRLELRTNSGSYGGVAAVYVRTVKTASGGTAVQVVHSTHYPGTLHDALDRIHRHSGAC